MDRVLAAGGLGDRAAARAGLGGHQPAVWGAGERGQDLRNLYAQFGHVLRRACPGWRVAVLSSEERLLAHMGLELDTSIKMVNGGVNVRLGRGRVPEGLGHG